MKKINIKKLKGNVNYILFNYYNFGINKLKKSDELTEIVGVTLNEINKNNID